MSSRREFAGHTIVVGSDKRQRPRVALQLTRPVDSRFRGMTDRQDPACVRVWTARPGMCPWPKSKPFKPTRQAREPGFPTQRFVCAEGQGRSRI
jgi:hypothetical protein